MYCTISEEPENNRAVSHRVPEHSSQLYQFMRQKRAIVSKKALKNDIESWKYRIFREILL